MSRWLLFTLLTMGLWGGWGVISKPLAATMSPWQVQCLSTLGFIPVFLWLSRSPQLRSGSNPPRGFWQAFAAGVIGSLGNVAYYQALALGGKVAAVIPFTALYPLATIILAFIFLRERLHGIQLGGVMASLAALYCFNIGSPAEFLSPWLAVALLPIGLWGTSALCQKLATFHASNELATLAFLLGFIPVALLTPLWQPISSRLTGTTWLLLFLLGLFFGLGNVTLIFAYGTGGRASIVTPLASLYSLVTIPLAVLFLNERVTLREGIGITLALIAVVALSWEKRPTSSPSVPVSDSTPRLE